MPSETIPPVDTALANASSIGLATMSRQSRSRAQSISSDKPSTIGVATLMSPPLSVEPEAAFIAASAASQIVTSDHDSHSGTWYDQIGIDSSGETALVTARALQLANSFVDQLLFNILSVAKTTALPSLRSAVVDVLKPKLAKDAINTADEELREYIGGGEIEDLARSTLPESRRDWDLEFVWKRTRLRCMVYSSLGDMEEEDEDYWLEQEHLNGENDDTLMEAVSPAVAIFLTSILEFTGEQVLVVAGQAAFNRLRAKSEQDLKDGLPASGYIADRIIVEELDMERVALDRTFGRLWRAWKKRIRSPMEPNFSRPFSRSSTSGSGMSPGMSQSRHESANMDPRALVSPHDLATTPEYQESPTDDVQTLTSRHCALDTTAAVDPSMIPLPEADREATYSDEEDTEDEDFHPLRPKSWIVSNDSMGKDLSSSQTSLGRALSLPSRKRRRFSLLLADNGSDLGEKPIQSESAQELNSSSVQPQTNDELASYESQHEANDTSANKSAPRYDAENAKDAGEASNGLLEKVASGAAAVGAAAVAGLAVLATGVAPQTDIEEDSKENSEYNEPNDEIEDFAEEPEILTSSRVSMGGRNSPAVSDQGRPPSIVHTRSSSVRSVRVIDVQSPRSPVARSRPESLEVDPINMLYRSTSISREGSQSRTPPIVEENDFRAIPSVTVTNTKPISRMASSSSSSDDTGDVRATLTPSPRNRSPPRRTYSPVAPITSGSGKTAGSNNAVSMMQEERPERHESLSRSSSGFRNPPLPTLPERSASRPLHVTTMPVGRTSPESPNLPRPIASESPSSARFKPVRTSEDNNSARPADVARNFEELIHSNETLQYTLTPENMRKIDSPTSLTHGIAHGSPQTSHKSVKSEDYKGGERSRSSSLKRSISVNKSTGLHSHPPADMAGNEKYAATNSKAHPPVSLRNRAGPVPVARDARVPRESIQDFAEFIRSTGPPGANGQFANGPQLNRANIGGPTPATANAPLPPKSSSMDVRRGPRLQARDATVNASSESSELIDFIRRGPPAANSSMPRIPRTVAPFRNTQDSEYMSSAVGGRAVDATIPNVRNSQASTNVTESSAPSSMNSQSALLNGRNKQKQLYSATSFDDDAMMPKRTQRRVRDPYAIDFSDEEEEDEDLGMTPKPQPPAKKEESLIDFLNNYPPPAEPEPVPFVLPKKKSAPNLIARLRSGSSSGFGGTSQLRKGSALTGPSETRSLKSRQGARPTHTPIVVPTTTSDRFGTQVNSPSSPRAPHLGRSGTSGKRFEPRGSTSSSGQTADLASFLRESGPSPSMMAAHAPPLEDRSSSGFSRMFERRKKSTAY
ncbi:hypothetical protein F5Y18DRAFT_340749 [Xylariaceae sp. FL1019]|nr:hypothetical protein F5Y18DRAFT_340749 [Xylariaceae sp. FL1019]